MTGDIISEIKCHLNCTAAGEHVPEAERAVRVIKERIRCVVTTWPFKMVPQAFKISLIKFVVFWINAIPQMNSIIPNICSKAIIMGQFPDFTKHCQLSFGAYVHAHNPRNITNMMAPQTSPAIALGPIPNIQGSHRFYCLDTKRMITHRQWTELPTPKSVIDLVHDVTMKERSRMKKAKRLIANANEYLISAPYPPTKGVDIPNVPMPTPDVIPKHTHGNPIDQVSMEFLLRMCRCQSQWPHWN